MGKNIENIKKKIVAVVPVFARYELLKTFYEYYKEFGLKIIWIVSPEDKYYNETLKLLSDEPHVVKFENTYLSNKINKGIQYLIAKDNKIECDYMMNLGSDDFILEDLLEVYSPYMKEKYDLIGINELYIYSTIKRQAIKYKYNEKANLVIGAGRLISTKILKRMRDNAKTLYSIGLNRGLDSNSQSRVRSAHKSNIITIRDNFEEPLILDVKTGYNITPYGCLEPLGSSIDLDFLRKYYPTVIK